MSEENKALVRRVMNELWQDGDLSAVDRYYSADFVDHYALPGLPQGRDGLRAFASMLDQAFADADVEVESQVAEGALVTTRWFSTSTHVGDFMGVPATGKQVSINGIGIARISDGKITDTWGLGDMMGLMQQLGAIPGPE
jgi:steroid delta-isomerase-like uncharacterized protein